jgi:hypothetical protein
MPAIAGNRCENVGTADSRFSNFISIGLVAAVVPDGHSSTLAVGTTAATAKAIRLSVVPSSQKSQPVESGSGNSGYMHQFVKLRRYGKAP